MKGTKISKWPFKTDDVLSKRGSRPTKEQTELTDGEFTHMSTTSVRVFVPFHSSFRHAGVQAANRWRQGFPGLLYLWGGAWGKESALPGNENRTDIHFYQPGKSLCKQTCKRRRRIIFKYLRDMSDDTFHSQAFKETCITQLLQMHSVWSSPEQLLKALNRFTPFSCLVYQRG